MSAWRGAGRIRPFIEGKLELLYGSLQDLGQRLRRALAQTLGDHAGAALCEAVEGLLGWTALPQEVPYPRGGYPYPADPYDPEEEEETGLWTPEDAPPGRHQPPKPSWAKRGAGWPQWLTAALHLLRLWPAGVLGGRGVWVLAGLGTVAGLLALAGVPVVGPAVAALAAGAVLLGLADGIRDAVSKLLALARG